MTITGFAIVLIGSAVLFVLVAAVRFGRLGPRWLFSLASVCGIALLAMLVSDWPLDVLSKFWADHSVLSAVLSTVLFVGVGVLAFEAHDTRVQEALDGSVTAAGMGGIVDHVIDIEVALALASAPCPPDVAIWGDWAEPGRPLRWLRRNRHLLEASDAGRRPSATDPRAEAPTQILGPDSDIGWRVTMLDQCVRRVIGGLRDWTHVVGRSRNGQQALVQLGALRIRLLRAQSSLENGKFAEALEEMTGTRRDCRILTLALERGSRSPSLREEVLLTLEPYPSRGGVKKRSQRWARIERDTWHHHCDQAYRELVGTTPNPMDKAGGSEH